MEMEQGGAPADEGTSAPDVANENESSESPPSQAESRKYKVKVDGQQNEVTEDELVKSYELSRASHMRMQQGAEAQKQAAQVKREYEQLLSEYEQDPWKLFQKLQVDPDLAAEQRLLKKLEREMMSPAEKALYEREENLTQKEKQLKAFEEAKQAHDEALAKEQEDQLTYKAIKEIDAEIGEVLKATGEQPTPRMIARVAEIMLAHLDSDEDGERLGANEAYGKFKEEMATDVASYLATLPPEELIKVLPKASLDALRKHELAKVRGTNPISQVSKSEFASNPSSAKSKISRTSTDNFFDKLEKKLK